MDNANLYLSLISAAGTSLVGAAAIRLWRQKTHLPYRSFLLGGAFWAIAVQIKFAVAVPANLIVCDWTEPALLPMAALSVAILHWCWIQFGRQDSAPLLEPEMAVVN